MEASNMEQAISDLKKNKKITIPTESWEKIFRNLEILELDRKTIYVNGASEELRKYCLSAKESVKIRPKS